MLRSDLHHKIIWHNDKKLDFCVLVRNDHACLGACLAHKDHPYSLYDRRIILFTVLLFDFAVAVGITWYLAFYTDVDGTTEFLVNEGVSYLVGVIMSVGESFLAAIARCACCERLVIYLLYVVLFFFLLFCFRFYLLSKSAKYIY